LLWPIEETLFHSTVPVQAKLPLIGKIIIAWIVVHNLANYLDDPVNAFVELEENEDNQICDSCEDDSPKRIPTLGNHRRNETAGISFKNRQFNLT
jgi:hypothetical protein